MTVYAMTSSNASGLVILFYSFSKPGKSNEQAKLQALSEKHGDLSASACCYAGEYVFLSS